MQYDLSTDDAGYFELADRLGVERFSPVWIPARRAGLGSAARLALISE